MDYNLLAMHLNTDVDDKSIGTESYRDIRNMRPYKGRFGTIEGNRLLVPTTRTVIGSVYDSVYECNYFLLKDVDDEHAILRVFRTGEYDYILDNQGVLNFKKDISHIDVIDGRWLSFTDGYDNGVSDYNPPRLIDIHMCDGFTNEIEQKTYKRGQARSRGELVYLCINDDTEATGDVNDNWKLLGRKYTTISSNHITRAKNEPYAPPSVELIHNKDITSSAISNNVYKFAYTYIYQDGSESRLSPYSESLYTVSYINKITSFFLNEILIKVDTGDELVDSINIHVLTKSNVWNSCKVINKKNHLGQKLINDNVIYEYKFNGGDILTEVVDKTGFNASPQSSMSSCFSSVGRVIDGNTTEFYDYQDIDFNVDVYKTFINNDIIKPMLSYWGLGGTPWWKLPEYDGNEFVIFISINIFSITNATPQSPAIGNYGFSYVLKDYLSYPLNAITNLCNDINNVLGGAYTAEGVNSTTWSTENPDSIILRPKPGVGQIYTTTDKFYVYTDDIYVKKALSYDNYVSVGIAYYDEKGRTPGVFSTQTVRIPNPNENEDNQSLISYTPSYNIRMSINSKPPYWAKYWCVAASKQFGWFEQFVITEAPSIDNDFVKFKKTWVYEDGDVLILRYLLKSPSNINYITNPSLTEYADYDILSQLYSYEVLKSDSEYIYISSQNVFPYGFSDDEFFNKWSNVLFEIRHKFKYSDSNVMVETDSFGTVSNGKHEYMGNIQNKSITFTVKFYDSFFTPKKHGILSRVGPDLVGRIAVNYISLVGKLLNNEWSILDGRPSYEDKTIRRTNFRNRLRWTGVYVPNGGVNKLNYNKFTDYIDLSSVHGSINHVGESNGIMSVKQNRKTTSIYVGKQGLTQAAGENYDLVVSSETVLGSRYESRTDIGCINPESYVKTSSGSYFFDKIGGRIVFDSQSGLQDISTGFINELIKDKQTIQSAYIGAPYYEVWFYLGNEIVVWSERDKKWIYRVDVSGIEHITNSDIILTCKDGIWVHDSSVRKLYNISINNKVSIQVSPVVRSTAKTLAIIASDSVDVTLSDSARLTNTPHGLARKKDDIWYYPIRRFGDVHNGSVPRFDTALLTLNKQSVLPMTIHQLSVKLI